ncbi:DUF2799 domain-containing protein [Brevundimonas lenta]|uniref:DUF2799 domain-containing protein n=1 Tax=Brevundimonas lenta TaxID=424796 RepID=A0A7W6NR43_9CAUL|nr:DUF2799 domain-containing protein [Brevundimonas lenta]MBB4083867.1 hypothetical protein [Brevundimonas lenta]
MRTILFAAAATTAALMLGSCATMSKDQCLAGDWSGQGYSDGASGLAQSRLGEHAEACMKHGIAPDDAAYRSGWSQGVITYCTPGRGFAEGRSGNGYAGVCPAELERDFMPAYEDGRVVYAAEQAVRDAESLINSLGGRLEELDDKLDAKQRELRTEGLTDEQRDVIRNRIQEVRREREDTERDWRRAQRALDDAEMRARDVRYRFERSYGRW